VGKTWFLRQIQKRLASEEYNPKAIYIDLANIRAYPSKAFYNAVLGAVYDGMLPEGARRECDAGEMGTALYELLDSTSTKVVLLFDAIERVPEELASQFLSECRAINLGIPPHKIPMVIAGSRRLLRLSTGQTSPFNHAEHVLLQDLSPSEARGLLMEICDGEHIVIEESAIDRLIKRSGGYPYLLKEILGLALKSPSEVINTVDIDQAIDAFVRIGINDECLSSIAESVESNLDMLELLLITTSRVTRPDIPLLDIEDVEVTGAFVWQDGKWGIRNDVIKTFLETYFDERRIADLYALACSTADRWEDAKSFYKREPVDERRKQKIRRISVRKQHSSDLVSAIVAYMHRLQDVNAIRTMLVEAAYYMLAFRNVGLYTYDAVSGQIECIEQLNTDELPTEPFAGVIAKAAREKSSFEWDDYRLLVAPVEYGNPVDSVLMAASWESQYPVNPVEADELFHLIQQTGIAIQTGRQEKALIETEKARLAALEELSGGIAHELHSPIGALVSACDIMAIYLSTLPEALDTLLEAELDPDTLDGYIQLLKDLSVGGKIDVDLEIYRDERKKLTQQLSVFGQVAAKKVADILAWLGRSDAAAKLVGLSQTLDPRVLSLIECVGELAISAAAIRSSVRLIKRNVDGLSSQALVDTGPKEQSDVNKSIEIALIILRNMLEPGVRVKTKFSSLKPLLSFPGILTQIWINIIRNAVEAMEGKGQIIIETKEEGENVVVTITDSGPGIPEQMQPHVFDLSATAKWEHTERGWGLYLSKMFVERHGGSIKCQSRPGKTTFRVILPYGGATT
jgi:signal transduction histidine kinase